MAGRAVATTSRSSEAMNRASPVMTMAQTPGRGPRRPARGCRPRGGRAGRRCSVEGEAHRAALFRMRGSWVKGCWPMPGPLHAWNGRSRQLQL